MPRPFLEFPSLPASPPTALAIGLNVQRAEIFRSRVVGHQSEGDEHDSRAISSRQRECARGEKPQSRERSRQRDFPGDRFWLGNTRAANSLSEQATLGGVIMSSGFYITTAKTTNCYRLDRRVTPTSLPAARTAQLRSWNIRRSRRDRNLRDAGSLAPCPAANLVANVDGEELFQCVPRHIRDSSRRPQAE